jgi:hypothetical protein
MAFQGFTMSPPYAGLDLVSPIDNMEPQYALELVNVFPGAGAPTVRLGYEQFCNIGVSTPIKLLAPLYLILRFTALAQPALLQMLQALQRLLMQIGSGLHTPITSTFAMEQIMLKSIPAVVLVLM